jgi:hypothetical protein
VFCGVTWTFSLSSEESETVWVCVMSLEVSDSDCGFEVAGGGGALDDALDDDVGAIARW